MARCGLLTLDTVGGKETDVAGLQRIVMRELWGTSLRLRFSRQRGVVHLHKDRERKQSYPVRLRDREERVRRQERDVALINTCHVKTIFCSELFLTCLTTGKEIYTTDHPCLLKMLQDPVG